MLGHQRRPYSSPLLVIFNRQWVPFELLDCKRRYFFFFFLLLVFTASLTSFQAMNKDFNLHLYTLLSIYTGSHNSCWISNGEALLYVVCVPVAVILAFNLAALVLSVVAIRRTRQVIVRFRKRIEELRNKNISCRKNYEYVNRMLFLFLMSHGNALCPPFDCLCMLSLLPLLC